MDHKAFLSSLDPEQRDGLTKLSNAEGLCHLAGHWGGIGFCTALIMMAVPFWPLIMLPLGVLLVFLFTLLHETSHKTPFKSKWLNDAIGHVCGFTLFLPATWFRYFHFAHHRFTQIPGKDPELAEAKPQSLTEYLRLISGIPVWINHAKTLVRNALGRHDDAFVPKASREKVTYEARFYLFGYAAMLGLSLWQATPILLYVWLLPMLFGQPFLRLYLLAEHGRCALVVNMFENTRTTLTNRLVRAIAWNMPYHTEHHCYPSVPFHNLPKLHTLIEPHLEVTAHGYAAFNKFYLQELPK